MAKLLNQSGIIHILPLLIIITAVGIMSFLLIASTAPLTGIFGALNPRSASYAQIALTPCGTPVGSFCETFDGAPSTPQKFGLPNWDVVIHNRDSWDIPDYATEAMHGMDCAGPPATHTVNTFDQLVFQCKDHMMTTIGAGGYGAIYLTPNQQVDFSNGEAVVRFDVSTARTSLRDWIDIWISPFDENLSMPLEDWLPDLQGPPKHAIQFNMKDAGVNNTTFFSGHTFNNFTVTDLPAKTTAAYESVLTPSAATRSTFELHISKTHIKFGMPAYNLWWVDTDMADLGWSRGVVQFGHHSYNAGKDCGFTGLPTCGPNTWHWDNVGISPALPFTMVKATPQFFRKDQTNTVFALNGPAPTNAHVRFSGHGTGLQMSFDKGVTWIDAQLQAQELNSNDQFKNYWTPIPAGISNIQVRGDERWWLFGNWEFRDLSVWSSNSPTGTPLPTTPSPTPTATPSPSACLKASLGDINCSNTVDIFDYSTLVGNYNKSGTAIQGDLNNDGMVDIFDYNILVSNFGK